MLVWNTPSLSQLAQNPAWLTQASRVTKSGCSNSLHSTMAVPSMLGCWIELRWQGKAVQILQQGWEPNNCVQIAKDKGNPDLH